MNKIFALGSLNMDLVMRVNKLPESGETLFGEEFFTNFGGKGANQAVASSNFGAQTIMLGAVGTDVFGSSLIENLKKANVETKYIQQINSSSGVAVIILENNDNRIMLDSGANYKMDEEKIYNILNEMLNENDILISQLEIPPDIIDNSFKIAKRKKAKTIFNPAPAKTDINNILNNSDILILNESEYNTLFNNENTEKIAKQFNTLILTLGAKGSLCYSNESKIISKSFKVDAVDTTGAGDCFIGTFAAALCEGLNLNDSLVYATAASAIAVTKKGAQDALPKKSEVLKFLSKQ